MTALAFALSLGLAPGPQSPPWYHAWRLIERPELHVGARPAAFIDNEGEHGRRELGAGVTVQVSWLGAL